MNKQKIEILQKEVADAKWEFEYHSAKVSAAKIKLDIFTDTLQQAINEQELLNDYTGER
mgnify:CR=1 FL=1|tara:strand:+ start:412 stop:588 length:177 start_codon:yes stop_codon:yes gene_type:complete